MPSPRSAPAGEDKKTVAVNRKARHEYHVLDTIEAGIALRGTEVKSVRAGKVNLGDAYAQVEHGEVFLLQMHISPYEQGNRFNHDPLRPRKLLLHTRQILKIQQQTQEKGLTVIPLSLYFKGRHLKVELGLVRGKRLHDRREDLAKRDAEREMQRARRGERDA
ncbi:MAG: SsrA-binding protein SmpB [Candidatus Eisenbacteria bacterium]|nr:SsrA-binding protein SmpB [Candidatus Eisenbacteria bacterium]